VRPKDGSSWDLTSANISLADHVGHTVSVTGTVPIFSRFGWVANADAL